MSGAPNILIMEGNLPANCKRAVAHGTVTAADRYALSLKLVCPAVRLTIIGGADLKCTLPSGVGLSEYDGVVVGGSGLHAYDTDECITRQIAFMKTVFEAGVPVLGSCWGLQISVIAAGGTVEKSLYGREMGIARKVTLTPEGQSHPLFAGKAAVFDTPCIHLDEVTQVPPGAVVLASNRHSFVQALAFESHGTPFWGVQYHPEFDLFHMSRLYTMYEDLMLTGGFFSSADSLKKYAANMEVLSKDSTRYDLAWQLGADSDVLDDQIRTLEIRNWVEHMVLPRLSAKQ